MYSTHQPIIQDWAMSSADNLARVLQFACLSARVPFRRAVNALDMAERGGEDAMAVLFGHRSRAYIETWAKRDAIYFDLQDIALDEMGRGDETTHAEMLLYVASLTGFGFAKAGFALQMAYGISGCLDTHNLTRFGLDPYIARGRVNERPCKRETMLARAKLYNATCAKLGGTGGLWDTWCEYMATKYPKTFRNAEHVSHLHLVALNIAEEGFS